MHPLTHGDGNYSETAHIRAFSPLGPRGAGRRPKDVHDLSNLILLCPTCHKLIDDKPSEYPDEVLRAYKQEHERRIFELTAIGPELRTTVLQLKGTIGGQHVDIPAPEVRAAVAPRYVVAGRNDLLIDLTGLRIESEDFYRHAHKQIRKDLRTYLGGGIDGPGVRHFSVFALAPIPVLACFGRELGDKLSIDLFQRHRDQSWKWKANGVPVEYEFRVVREGSERHAVGLILSLSGAVTQNSLPTEIDGRFWLYEIVLKGRNPGRDFLRLRDDLARFRRTYQEALGTITKNHDGLSELHLFPAVPAPVAIACGQELLPKVHPDLVVYDNVKGTFVRAITINTREDL